MLTKQALDKLLECLDSNRERAGEKYETLRRKLMKFFEWRACAVVAQDLTDETINRVARLIEEGETVRNLSNYAYGVAHIIHLEHLKKLKREERVRHSIKPVIEPEDDFETERRECLEACLNKLSDGNRDLIVTYYREQRRAKINLRRELADRLGIPLNALRIRAHRIRTQLEECAVNCMQRSQVR